MRKSLIVAGSILSIAGLGTTATYLYYRFHTDPVEINAGGDVFSVLPEAVRQLTYKTTQTTFEAKRRDEGPFSVRITFKNGTPTKTCAASADLNGNLAALSKIVAKASGSADPSAYPFPVGTLEIKTMIVDEEASIIEYRRRADMSGVLLHNGLAIETNVPYQALSAIERLCNKTQTPKKQP